MRGVIWQTWWPAIDTLPPDIFARLHRRISLLPAGGPGIHCDAGRRAHEPGGLDDGSLVAVAALHCPSSESRGYSIVIFRTPAAQSLHSIDQVPLFSAL